MQNLNFELKQMCQRKRDASGDRLAPRLALAGVDLAQVQHLALRHAPIGKAPVLDKVPVLVGLAVLHASSAAQEHASTLWTPLPGRKDQGLHYKHSGEPTLYESNTCVSKRAEIAGKQRWVEKDGLVGMALTLAHPVEVTGVSI